MGVILAVICGATLTILFRQEAIMALIDDLATDVEANTSVVQSAVTLLGNLSDQLKAAGTDPAKLQKIKDTLDASKQALADAVAANTPAAPSDTPAVDPNA